jgi:hypothetical protein
MLCGVHPLHLRGHSLLARSAGSTVANYAKVQRRFRRASRYQAMGANQQYHRQYSIQ